jgi:hypothetical protein
MGGMLVLTGLGVRTGVGVGLEREGVRVAQGLDTQGVILGTGVLHVTFVHGVRVASPPGGFGLGPVGCDMAASTHISAPTATSTIPVIHLVAFFRVVMFFLLPPM